jgi:hypothetical protein
MDYRLSFRIGCGLKLDDEKPVVDAVEASGLAQPDGH